MKQFLTSEPKPTTKTNIGSEIAILLLETKNQLKVFHWQTTNFSTHKTLDKLFTLLTAHNDKWVETFMGKYGRIRLNEKNNSLQLINLEHLNISIGEYLDYISKQILEYREQHFSNSLDSDLSNIMDEIIADINRARYLLTLT